MWKFIRTMIWKLIWEHRGKKAEVANSSGRNLKGLSDEILKNTAKEIVTLLELNQKDIVLDIACAGGTMDMAIAPFVKSIVGIDYCNSMVNRAKENTHNYSNIRIMRGNAAHIPCEDMSFTKIICYGMLMYLRDTKEAKKVMQEIKRVSHPGARVFIVSSPVKKLTFLHLLSYYRLKGKVGGLRFFVEIIGNCLFHLHLQCDLEELIGYASELGMRIILQEENRVLPPWDSAFNLLLEVSR